MKQTCRAMCLSLPLLLVLSFIHLPVRASDPDATFRQEADAFLENMASGLQKHQASAIRDAMNGDLRALSQVREARNEMPPLPEGVVRSNISDRLALFRDIRFSVDTIPLLVYFHGGGWTIGSINSCSRFCAAVAARGIAVLAVDYRLAPEHKFPAGLRDCISAVALAADSLDAWRCSTISLGGDSSGANLAIATAMSFPENTFRCLVAFYPVTQATPDGSASWREFGEGFGLDSDLMDAFNESYTTSPHDPLVSPVEASETELSYLPPTLVIRADRDILRDQGVLFVKRLRQSGVCVRHEILPGTVHLFITVPGQKSAFDYSVAQASLFIRETSDQP